MPQSLTSLLVHLVFSTKNRTRFIDAPVRPELYAYGMFSVSESNRDAVTTYIASQEEHHRRMTFQDEFRQFLEKHRIAYDEQYVWD